MNYNELTEQFIADQDWAKETVKWYRRQLGLFIHYVSDQSIDLNTMTAGDFTRMLRDMRDEGYSYSARNGIYTASQNYCKWAKAHGHLQSHPFSDPDMKPKRPSKERKVVKTVELSHIRSILRMADADDDTLSRRDSAIVHLLVTTGMRRAEVASLNLEDISLESKEIILKKTKFRHERYAFLTDEALASLERWLAWRPKCTTERVFITLTFGANGIHQPIRPDVVNKVLERVVRKANISADVWITPHMLRHTFATEVAKVGDPVALMQLMGHTNFQSTERYIHPDKGHLRNVARKGPGRKKKS